MDWSCETCDLCECEHRLSLLASRTAGASLTVGGTSMMSRFIQNMALLGLAALAPQFGLGAYLARTNLVSDVPQLAPNVDANLVNSWGIAHGPGMPWWVADN